MKYSPRQERLFADLGLPKTAPRPRIKMDKHRICWALFHTISGVLVRSRATTWNDARRLSAHYPGSEVSMVEEFSKGDSLYVEIPIEREDGTIKPSRSKPLSWDVAYREFLKWELKGYHPKLVPGRF